MITELQTDTFHHWLEIAAEASANAETARTIAIEPGRDDNDTFNLGLERDFRASMTAVYTAKLETWVAAVWRRSATSCDRCGS